MSRRLLYLLLLLMVAAALLFLRLPVPPTYMGRTIENAGHTPLFFLITLGILFFALTTGIVFARFSRHRQDPVQPGSRGAGSGRSADADAAREMKRGRQQLRGDDEGKDENAKND